MKTKLHDDGDMELVPCWECKQHPLVDKGIVFCANPKCKAHLPIKGRKRWNELSALFASKEFKEH